VVLVVSPVASGTLSLGADAGGAGRTGAVVGLVCEAERRARFVAAPATAGARFVAAPAILGAAAAAIRAVPAAQCASPPAC
jgi:hypothetical protein